MPIKYFAAGPNPPASPPPEPLPDPSPDRPIDLPGEDPPEDPRIGWEKEDIEMENRKPTMEETEEDTGDF
jgi:hypothetical protein